MTEQQALLQAVLAEPEEDAPRLVFADWLEEYGDAPHRGWAELIRVQVAKARLTEESPAWRKLDRADRGQRDKHKEDLFRPFKGMAITGHVIRGFVERLTMHARRFMSEGDRLFTLTPLHTLRFVSLSGHNKNEPSIPELLDSPPVAKLRGVDLEGSRLTRPACEVMARHPHTKQLRALALSRATLIDDTLPALFPTGAWPRLTDLRLEWNPLAADGVRHLAGAAPATLESLSLAESLRSGEAVAALAGADLPALTHLDLSGCTITDAAAAALAKAPFAGQLQVLALSTAHGLYGRFDSHRSGRFGDDGLLALACSERLRGLRSLNVSGQGFTDRGLRSLLAPGVFPRLESLDLRGIRVSKPLQGELRKRYGVGVCRFSPG